MPTRPIGQVSVFSLPRFLIDTVTAKDSQEQPVSVPRKTSAIRLAKVAARRQQLATLAMEMMREKGYNAFSVNDLAERAEMSIGGLYRYIKTKSDLLEIICDQINEGMYEQMLSAAASMGSREDKLKAAYTVYWDTVWDSDEAVLMAYREWQSLPVEAQRRYIKQEAQIYSTLADVISAGVGSGEFRPVNAPLLASEMIYLAQMRALKGWAFNGLGKEAVFAEHWDLISSRLRK